MMQWSYRNVGPLIGFAILTVAAVVGVLYLRRPGPPSIPVDGPIIAFGDSLIEGVGASEGNDIPSRLSRRLGIPVTNAGKTGATTNDGLGRLYSEVIAKEPRIVILSLGHNDVLLLQSKEQMIANIEDMVDRITQKGSFVVLLGVRCGLVNDECATDFARIAEHAQISLVPSVLDGVIGRPGLMSDPIHPNDEGYARLTDKIEPVLSELLSQL